MDLSTQTPKRKVLIVEDEEFIRDLYVQTLKEQNLDVQAVGDGETAFNAMHEGGFDLVLLDIMLPKMDGLAILEKLQTEQPLKPNKVIILLTNLDQELTIAKGVSLGIRGYLIKSQITPKQFKEEVLAYLNAVS